MLINILVRLFGRYGWPTAALHATANDAAESSKVVVWMPRKRAINEGALAMRVMYRSVAQVMQHWELQSLHLNPLLGVTTWSGSAVSMACRHRSIRQASFLGGSLHPDR